MKEKRQCPIHDAWVKSHECMIEKDIGNGMENCNQWPVDHHHLTKEGDRGIAQKAHGMWQVSLCRNHHSELTVTGDEREFWKKHKMSYQKARERAKELSLSSPSKLIRTAMQKWIKAHE